MWTRLASVSLRELPAFVPPPQQGLGLEACATHAQLKFFINKVLLSITLHSRHYYKYSSEQNR